MASLSEGEPREWNVPLDDLSIFFCHFILILWVRHRKFLTVTPSPKTAEDQPKNVVSCPTTWSVRGGGIFPHIGPQVRSKSIEAKYQSDPIDSELETSTSCTTIKNEHKLKEFLTNWLATSKGGSHVQIKKINWPCGLCHMGATHEYHNCSLVSSLGAFSIFELTQDLSSAFSKKLITLWFENMLLH